jgi:RimJ/RimL family protein N-acetyltransferase
MTFEWTCDLELVRLVITHPKLFDWVTDDSVTRETFQASPDARYVVVADKGVFLGIFVVIPQSRVLAIVHTCLLPVAWGKSERIYRLGLGWLFTHSRIERVVGHIRADNRLALRAAERAGLERIGLNKACVLKHGRLQDQWILGISKKDLQHG